MSAEREPTGDGFVVGLIAVALLIAGAEAAAIYGICCALGATSNTKLVLCTQGPVMLLLVKLVAFYVWAGPKA